MRYHWGLGVGHFHAHGQAVSSAHIPRETAQVVSPTEHDDERSAQLVEPVRNRGLNHDSSDSDSNDAELMLGDRQHEGWEDVNSGDEPSEDELIFEGGEDDFEDFTGL